MGPWLFPVRKALGVTSSASTRADAAALVGVSGAQNPGPAWLLRSEEGQGERGVGKGERKKSGGREEVQGEERRTQKRKKEEKGKIRRGRKGGEAAVVPISHVMHEAPL